MTKAHHGLCIGGPLDGKLVSHLAPFYHVAEQDALLPYLLSARGADAPTEPVKYDTFTYNHRHLFERGVWVPEPVMRNERYQHKIWGHWIEYVMDSLMRNYRPEGF